MTEDTPEVITRYFAASDAQNPRGVADCFTPDGTALDEGVTYTGRDEITAWREKTISQWTYTTTITGSAPVGDGYRVTVHLEGDFPGGEVDLHFDFALRDGLIAALRIA